MMNDYSYRSILTLALPLILSTTGTMVMQFLDGLYLSWHSAEAIAALGPAGLASWTVLSLFFGTCSYTATFIAQYLGAKRPGEAGRAAWQGLYCAAASAVVVAIVTFFTAPLFHRVGHAPGVAAGEAIFYSIVNYGAFFVLAGGALTGFFSSCGQTTLVMKVQLASQAVNAVLAYGLIFGKWGLPAWGIAGAALGNVIAQACGFFLFLFFFLSPPNRQTYGTWAQRHFHPALFRRLLRFGFPSGLRMGAEVAGWTVFLLFVGRQGMQALAASNIAWRINGFAFFPLIGLSQAISILVGKAQGAGSPEEARKVTYRGLFLAEGFMVTAGIAFLLFPRALFGLFHPAEAAAGADFAAVLDMGVVLLRFVAAYCLLDSVNIVVMGALQAAGDTRWTFLVTVAGYGFFLFLLFLADRAGLGVYPLWGIATVFVLLIALVWLVRFERGGWRRIRVIQEE